MIHIQQKQEEPQTMEEYFRMKQKTKDNLNLIFGMSIFMAIMGIMFLIYFHCDADKNMPFILKIGTLISIFPIIGKCLTTRWIW